MSVDDADNSPEVGGKDKFEDQNVSPNIRNSADEPGGDSFDAAKEAQRKRETVEIDGVPIDSDDIEYRSDNIKSKDHSDFFVKVEGAKRIAREKERAAKKESEAQAKRIRDAAREEKRQQQKAKDDEKRAERQATNEARKQKINQIKAFIIRFKRVIICIIVAIALIILTFTVFIPLINAGLAAKQEADTAKVIEENRTDMLKILAKLIGKEATKKEVEDTVSSFGGDIVVFFEEEEGSIHYKEGGVEIIRFSVMKSGKESIAYRFEYINVVDGRNISIAGAEDTYYYSNGEDLKESSNPSELIDECILFISGHES